MHVRRSLPTASPPNSAACGIAWASPTTTSSAPPSRATNAACRSSSPFCSDRGYIYKGSYTGQYCVFDELYVETPPGAPCPDCGRTTETVSEENYFFKLSAFERRLLEYYDEHPEFIRPETRRNEVISFVKAA